MLINYGPVLSYWGTYCLGRGIFAAFGLYYFRCKCQFTIRAGLHNYKRVFPKADLPTIIRSSLWRRMVHMAVSDYIFHGLIMLSKSCCLVGYSMLLFTILLLLQIVDLLEIR